MSLILQQNKHTHRKNHKTTDFISSIVVESHNQI